MRYGPILALCTTIAVLACLYFGAGYLVLAIILCEAIAACMLRRT